MIVSNVVGIDDEVAVKFKEIRTASDIIINNEKFNEIKECFIAQSVHTNPILKNKFNFRKIPDAKLKIDNYFKELLGNKLGEKYAKNFT